MTKTKKKFDVIYRISVETDSALTAALDVEETLKGQSFRPYLEVTDEEGVCKHIDLENDTLKIVESKPDKVRIHIVGGCADLIEKPYNIEVEMRDYDNDDEDWAGSKKDEEGEVYQEMIWEATVEVTS